MKNNLIIVNETELDKKREKIIKEGKGKFHVLADFDRTLTKAFVNGEKTPSVISILRNEDYLSEEYSKKAKELAEKYHPIEMNLNISVEERKKAMNEWWSSHFELLINSGLNKKHIEKVVESEKIKLRGGAPEFLDFLNEKNIPLIIFSSAGLGGDSISLYLEKQNLLSDNIHIVSNEFEWNDDGKAIGIKEPIIHVMNKDETTIQKYPVFEFIKNKRNVLLLGDSLGDVGMIKGFDYDTLIKVGFLNENVEENLENYEANFDAVILNDGNFDFVNEILGDIK